MTLTEALNALHTAGWIARPWLAGMLVGSGSRIIGPDPHFVGRILVARTPSRPNEAQLENLGDTAHPPDISDHATVGCLLALLREAVVSAQKADSHRRSTAYPPARTDRDSEGWVVFRWVRGGDEHWTRWGEERWQWLQGGRGDTEGEAIAAALIALAGAP